MSGRTNGEHLETLFSFELLVEYILIEKETQVSDELALGVRLLDFPTLLIHQPQQSGGGVNKHGHEGKDGKGEYAFNRGKSCFFKMNLNSLHTNVSSTPLYVMVLDVKEEIPKLVGTSLISLAKAMDRLRQDVTERGVSRPSSHGERGVVGLCNLTGDNIGSISLSYKLLSLGVSLLPRDTETGLKSTSVHGGEHVHQSITVKNIPESLPDESDVSRYIQSNKATNENTLINEDKLDKGVCDAMQTEYKPDNLVPQTLKETENNYEEDLTIFCPPHLFYNNSAEEKNQNEIGDCKLANLDSDAFTFEDTYSEEESSENASSPKMDRTVRHEKSPRNQETSEVTPNVLGEALRQLPLLNALLVELSQLNGQNPQQPLSIHPNLSWIYRPASTEPSAGYGNTPRKAQAKLLQKTGQGTSPHLKHVLSPRYCSTPVLRPVNAKDKQEEALIERKSSGKTPRKKLVYGTTKTFNLRLKQVSPLKVKRRECVDLIQKETQSSAAKGRTKSSNKIVKTSKRKAESRAQNQSSSLNENVETMIQSITVDSALQETFTLKPKTLHEKVHVKQDRDSPRISQTTLSERDFKCNRFPSVDGDNVDQNKDKKEHHSESNQMKSQAETVRHREKIESSGSSSSSHSSPKASFSASSGEGEEEADYADDFNSLEPSDGYSPDPVSSPESSRAKTARSPLRLDFCNSDPDRFQRRAVLPVPVKAPNSPQRTLRGTRIIRPRTHASALSFSSEDGDGGDSASLQTICSRKSIMTGSSRVERSSGTDGFISARGQRSGSTRNSGPVRGFSAESVSSFEPLEVEELEDELGSLDFKKEYQHISELVANKLPGYTM
ncbi:microtubule-associated protein 10 [Anoplopoma fimbria]|uniref:microtubule-associated protein 10 n=1 Tax=Anoplopoma fimbria TaxID=229290 RepID=UPI0023ED174E|nr:microtubule-associated protein 10 [Anoplopoma fimbria]